MTGWKGTPGPWKWSADKFTVVDNEARTVAMAWPDTRVPSDESRRRMLANAAGIAALPQLVEALLRVVQTGCGCGVMTKCECFSEYSLRIWREEVQQEAADALRAAGAL